MFHKTVLTGTSGPTATFHSTSAIPTSSLSPLEFQPTNLTNTTALLTKYDRNSILGMGLLRFRNTVLSTLKTKVSNWLFRCLLERACMDKFELSLSSRIEAVLSSGERALREGKEGCDFDCVW